MTNMIDTIHVSAYGLGGKCMLKRENSFTAQNHLIEHYHVPSPQSHMEIYYLSSNTSERETCL